MSKYAKTTSVSVERSKTEIEKTVKRYGVEEFFYGTSTRGDGIGFKFNGRVVKIPIPKLDRNEFNTDKQYDQAMRQRYRILLLQLKANLEAIDDGVSDFDQVFLAHICLGDGKPISQHLDMGKIITEGKMPKLLPAGFEK